MNKALVAVIAILVILGGVALWQRPTSSTALDLSDPEAAKKAGLDITNLEQATSTSGLPEVQIDTTTGR
ncbi:MAG: hypothetical protein V4674_03555 [Patescibacteria group bacterium]